MENNETQDEKGFTLTSIKHTRTSFKDVPFKLRLKILLGGEVWITTKAEIAIKQDTPPIPVNDGIELLINTNKPSQDGK